MLASLYYLVAPIYDLLLDKIFGLVIALIYYLKLALMYLVLTSGNYPMMALL